MFKVIRKTISGKEIVSFNPCAATKLLVKNFSQDNLLVQTGIDTLTIPANSSQLIITNENASVGDSAIDNILVEGKGEVEIQLINYVERTVDSPFIQGNKEITSTDVVDVKTYATAQVIDANLKPSNIVKGTSILGVVGSAESGNGGGNSISLTTTTGYEKLKNVGNGIYCLDVTDSNNDDFLYAGSINGGRVLVYLPILDSNKNVVSIDWDSCIGEITPDQPYTFSRLHYRTFEINCFYLVPLGNVSFEITEISGISDYDMSNKPATDFWVDDYYMRAWSGGEFTVDPVDGYYIVYMIDREEYLGEGMDIYFLINSPADLYTVNNGRLYNQGTNFTVQHFDYILIPADTGIDNMYDITKKVIIKKYAVVA